jgi:hypothetical protein
MMRTLEPFFLSPTKGHSLMELSRQIRLAHTSVKKNLDKLYKLGIVAKTQEIKGKRNFPLYKAYTLGKPFKSHKMIYNFTSIIESGVIELMVEKLAPKAIVLFGSYMRGEDTEESDIDLFVECRKEELDLKAYEKKLARKIALHFNENFAGLPKELKNNLINGIVLFGFLEAFK